MTQLQRPVLNRRRLLQTLGVGAAAVAMTRVAPSFGALAEVDRKRSIRIAHLTDVHVQPELDAGAGFTKCLHHMQSLSDKPELILFGGDMVFDTMSHDAARTQLLWDQWQTILKAENSLEWKPVVGNHDVFGWNKAKSKTTGTEALWGKKYALDRYGLPKSYYSFDRAGWHFVMLDSIFAHESGYVGQLDDEQFAWLEADLAAVAPSVPVLVLSHIPILSITSIIPDSEEASIETGISLKPGAMHMDFARLRKLFATHPNVKLCLSGHTHLLDDLAYQGVRYLCNGAVSGNWWKGNHLGQCAEGYTTLDLFDDGTADIKYHTYGWVAKVNAATEPVTRRSV